MTTTELYSGYSADGKSSSRVLRPPGGGSSNIFGAPEPPAPKEQVQQEMAQQSSTAQTQSPSNPTAEANEGYQKNKPKGRAEAPFAMFAESGKSSAPSQFDNCDTSSQNDADFRCYSVTDYRNAIAQNAAVKDRAHGAVQYNPITGEEYPAGYGQQKKEDEEEQEKDENEESEKDSNESNTTPTDVNNTSTEKTEPSPAPTVQSPPAPIQKVRQPPGGKSSGLW
ncbi:microtubule-associated protein Jupiter-like isoform X3 [Mercenaria mercenaria]|uniref:microtubule-associated protein Jupiter-like isoform X3 n=1 Tax=Mercenaria mercenaria TaxID=6596 RepID=UPI001E1D7D9F|nr:microtubule-associated protein Jupiter-like isoform X3 [Mercenaria mercenaria]